MYEVLPRISSPVHQDEPSPQCYRGDGYCVCMTLDTGFCSEIGQLEIV